LRSTECLVRLVDAATLTEIDRSDNWFAIVPSPAEITRPATQDPVYFGGNKDMIRWDVAESQMVRFEFSENGDGNWIAVSAPVSSDAKEIAWTIPVVNSKTARVRMINIETNNVVAISTPFRVLAGRLDLTSPRVNDVLTIGKKTNVCWTHNNVTKFDLQFSADGGASWDGIENGIIALKACYDWTVPSVKTQKGLVRAIWNNDPDMEYDRTESFTIDGFLSVNDMNGDGFAFFPPVPNPFDDHTQIIFRLPFDERVTITVYNAAGVRVAQLASEKPFAAGLHTLTFDGSGLSDGMYFVHFNAGFVNLTRAVVRVK